MKKCDQCEEKHFAKGKCKRHYKIPSQINPKPITSNKQAISKKSNNEIPKLLAELEKEFNTFIRNRDRNGSWFNCISCGEHKKVELMQAGHFFPKTFSAIRFDEDNVHGECIQCNCIDSNHLDGYKLNLVNKIGLERFKSLEAKKNNHISWDRETLTKLIFKYKSLNNN